MSRADHNSSSTGTVAAAATVGSVTVIVPARNEETVIVACIASLANQPEIAEILVVNDQSTDWTASVVSGLMEKIPNLRLLESGELPDGWVGKNHALWVGVQQAKCAWLLFTDADAEHERDSVSHALQNVNDPSSTAAAANGQFLMMRRDIYDAIGGHAGVAGEVLEDVALALRVKAAGHRISFGSGKGIVRVRMYRSFQAMWQGWKKNLYRLMGGTPWAVFREMESNLPWIPFLLLVAGLKYPFLLFLGVLLLIARQTSYGLDLARNQYPFSFIFYYTPAVALYVAVLWASYRSHVNGRIQWKGREYSVEAPESAR